MFSHSFDAPSCSFTSSFTLCHVIFHAQSRLRHVTVTLCHALSRSIFFVFSVFFHFFQPKILSRRVTPRHVTRQLHMTYFFILHIHDLPCLRCFFTTYFFILHMVCHAASRRRHVSKKCFFSDFHSFFIIFPVFCPKIVSRRLSCRLSRTLSGCIWT